MSKIKIEVDGWKCNKCEYEWINRIKKVPRICPKCKSVRWNDIIVTDKVKLDDLAEKNNTNNLLSENCSKLFKSVDEIIKRRSMLHMPHILPLTKFVDELNDGEKLGETPYFDPADGGINAKVLFLFEKPGPMADSSGFISRDNNDMTAENTYNFMNEASIPRELTCLWNSVPSWNGTRKITPMELSEGAERLKEIISLFPNLKVIVLVGKHAQKMYKHIKDLQVVFINSYHPSPINYATIPEKWNNISTEWSKVLKYI